ncbi:carbon-nitrogen hydrolase family protein [uncultured Brevibacillus sp.]|uniref:carbon-nitrogen hydrolase family protein n=1 Tax=uncultured Brevibacillus sp. TaxID=169970 RepID=UPI00259978EC|nr:carbon-nitrogen hydrolase family protein [uncultured Brevibacillus sp.]
MNKTTVATVAMEVTFDKQENVKKYLRYIEEASKKGAKLIVFPEQSLQGYLPSLMGPLSVEIFRHQHHHAETVPDGDTTILMVQAAQKHGIHIVWGMTERDRNRYDVLYNTAVLVGPTGFIGSYRKVHLPLDELHIYFPGSDFPVYDTEIGKIGLLICYDKCFPEATRELALKGAEIFVMPTAWALESDKESDPGSSRLALAHNLYDQVRASENQCWFISSNIAGVCGDTLYYGHSNIVDPSGRIVTTTGGGEGITFYEAELHGEILRARTEDEMGLYYIKDLKPQAYKQLAKGWEISGLTPLQTKDNAPQLRARMTPSDDSAQG